MRSTLFAYIIGITFILVASLQTQAQCGAQINFNDWAPYGDLRNGSWEVQGGQGESVFQGINGEPTFFISNRTFINKRIKGSFTIDDSDDDFIGFVFGYQSPDANNPTDHNYYLFDWKKRAQTVGGFPAEEGFALLRVNGNIPPAQHAKYFWQHTEDNKVEVLADSYGAGKGWVRNKKHSFELIYTSTKVIIHVDGEEIFSVKGCYEPGQFGFYNYSQMGVTYEDFEYDFYVDFDLDRDEYCFGGNIDLNYLKNSGCTTIEALGETVEWYLNDDFIASHDGAKAQISSLGTVEVKLKVTDASGCVAESVKSFNVAPPYTTEFQKSTACVGKEATVSATIPGPITNWTWKVDGAIASTEKILRITASEAGTKQIELRASDNNGCSAVSGTDITIKENPSYTTTVEPQQCLTELTGAITINSETTNSVRWNTGSTLGALEGLSSGRYKATITNDNGCFVQESFDVELISDLAGSITSTDVSCYNGDNGSATFEILGGVGTPKVKWSTGASTTFLDSLSAGFYSASVVDEAKCVVAVDSIEITAPEQLSIESETYPTTCEATKDGKIFISTSGGNGTYTYYLNDESISERDLLAVNSGQYTIKVEDGNGCVSSSEVIVEAEQPLNITFDVVNTNCVEEGGGSITATPNGGLAPYTYLWSNEGTQATISNQPAANYQLTVHDANGCVTSGETSIQEGVKLQVAVAKTDLFCYGDSDATIALTSDYSGTLSYLWEDGSSTQERDGLSAGEYAVTVTNESGCYVRKTVAITQPEPLSATAEVEDLDCYNNKSGQIKLNATGGTGRLNVLWPTIGENNFHLKRLDAGNYPYDIIDNNGCYYTGVVQVKEPKALSLSVTAQDLTCNGSNDGEMTYAVSGGTGKIETYYNGSLSSSSKIEDLKGGFYKLRALDENGCSINRSVVIIEPDEIVINMVSEDVMCGGDATGKASVEVSGGWGDFEYLWSTTPVRSTPSIEDVAAGNYKLKAADKRGCEAYDEVIIQEPEPLRVHHTTVDISCANRRDGKVILSVNGGVAPFQTFFEGRVSNDTMQFVNLAEGSYTYAVYDANGCVVQGEATIGIPDSIGVAYKTVPVSCFNGADGKIEISASGGGGSFEYRWVHNALLLDSVAEHLKAGLYPVAAVDQFGCKKEVVVQVEEPAHLSLNGQVYHPTCYGYDDGIIQLNPSGGNERYTIYFNDEIITGSITNLASGAYAVKLFDQKNCSTEEWFELEEPKEILVDLNAPRVVGIGGEARLSADVTPDGEYMFKWSGTKGEIELGMQSVMSNWPTSNETYELQVTDVETGCSGKDVITVRVSDDFVLPLPNAFTPDGDGHNDLFLDLRDGTFELISLKVYNRWGQIIYEGNEAWNGSFGGVVQPMGGYAYIAEIGVIGENIQKQVRGHVTIID